MMATPRTPEHLPWRLRRLAGDKKINTSEASALRAAADEIERLQRQLETARALQTGVHVCVVSEDRS